jgi:hypothetical protein
MKPSCVTCDVRADRRRLSSPPRGSPLIGVTTTSTTGRTRGNLGELVTLLVCCSALFMTTLDGTRS